MHDFLRWCAQFKGFPYSQVSFWIDAYERGNGVDCYGHRLDLMSGRTLEKRK